tara:strand:+ start:190 stop:378 length:189 start_codon:yes stop_codon:yes gene_type:complete
LQISKAFPTIIGDNSAGMRTFQLAIKTLEGQQTCLFAIKDQKFKILKLKKMWIFASKSSLVK